MIINNGYKHVFFYHSINYIIFPFVSQPFPQAEATMAALLASGIGRETAVQMVNSGCHGSKVGGNFMGNGWKLQDFPGIFSCRFLGAQNPGNLQDGAPSRAIAFSCLKNMWLNSMVGRYNEPVFMGLTNQIITGWVYEYHETLWFHFQNSGECLNMWWFIGILTGISWNYCGLMMDIEWYIVEIWWDQEYDLLRNVGDAGFCPPCGCLVAFIANNNGDATTKEHMQVSVLLLVNPLPSGTGMIEPMIYNEDVLGTKNT